VAILSALALAGCGSSSSTPPANTVHLVEFRFDPASLTVAHGQAVHFQNSGSVQHTVTIHDDAGDVLLDKTLQPGQSTDFTPSAAGSYHVFCQFHADRGMEMSLKAT
jgi:plastocyanin